MKRLLAGLWLLAVSSAVASSDGEYLARAGDCMACHTSDQTRPLAGGRRFATPIGDIFATNITPDPTYGIGNYSPEEFNRAMREGIARDGHRLYPAMPWPAYARMSDRELRVLYDYLMHEVTPQPVANRESMIPWPLSIRWPLAIWQQLFTDGARFRPRADRDARWNRGAWLVEGPGHCGACHTPRGMALQELALDHRDDRFLSGAELDGWYAPSLRGLTLSESELVALLGTGRSQHAAVSGPMDEVVSQNTAWLTGKDRQAIAHYLLSLHDESPPPARSHSDPQAQENGHTLYQRYCATCHGSGGEGSDYVIPALKGNLTVNADNPLTLLRVVLDGGETAITPHQLPYTMPGYGWTLTDRDAADVMNYLRNSWGNSGTLITPQQVQQARKAATVTRPQAAISDRKKSPAAGRADGT